MPHPVQPSMRSGHLVLGLLVTSALAAAACVTPPPDRHDPTQQQFCQFFEDAVEAPPTENEGVLVKEGVVAFATDTAVAGGSCTEPAARVELDGAALAEGGEVMTAVDESTRKSIAVATGERIAAGELVLDNLELRALSAYISLDGITVVGNLDIRLSGVTSTVGFSGAMRDLQNWSVRLSSSSFAVPGITSGPATFSGAIVVTHGVPTLTLNAFVAEANIGDLHVQDARVSLGASPSSGVVADVAGRVEVGVVSVDGSVDVRFDRMGNLMSVDADLSLRLRGVSAPGQYIDLAGDLSVTGAGTEAVLSFSGSGVIGDLLVRQASGTITLLGDRTTFVGVIDVAVGTTSVRYNGSIVWDGDTAHMPYFHLESGGEYSGVLDDGTLVRVAGVIETTYDYGGGLRTEVTGQVTLGSLTATGSAVVTVDGASTTLLVHAHLDSDAIEATLNGYVRIHQGRVQDVEIGARVPQLILDQVVLTDAELDISSVSGGPIEVGISGDLAVREAMSGSADLDARFGSDGSLLSLTGGVDVDMDLDGWQVEAAGQLAATPQTMSFAFDGIIGYGALGIDVAGTLAVDLDTLAWSLEGDVELLANGFRLYDGRFVAHQDDSARIHAGVYVTVFLGDPDYFGITIHPRPDGGCAGFTSSAHGPLVSWLLADKLEPAIGCDYWR